MNFLTAPQETNLSKNLAQLVDILYDKLKTASGSKFNNLLEQYPNLNHIHKNRNIVDTDSWATL
jgi:hypothetical protein